MSHYGGSSAGVGGGSVLPPPLPPASSAAHSSAATAAGAARKALSSSEKARARADLGFEDDDAGSDVSFTEEEEDAALTQASGGVKSPLDARLASSGKAKGVSAAAVSAAAMYGGDGLSISRAFGVPQGMTSGAQAGGSSSGVGGGGSGGRASGLTNLGSSLGSMLPDASTSEAAYRSVAEADQRAKAAEEGASKAREHAQQLEASARRLRASAILMLNSKDDALGELARQLSDPSTKTDARQLGALVEKAMKLHDSQVVKTKDFQATSAHMLDTVAQGATARVPEPHAAAVPGEPAVASSLLQQEVAALRAELSRFDSLRRRAEGLVSTFNRGSLTMDRVQAEVSWIARALKGLVDSSPEPPSSPGFSPTPSAAREEADAAARAAVEKELTAALEKERDVSKKLKERVEQLMNSSKDSKASLDIVSGRNAALEAELTTLRASLSEASAASSAPSPSAVAEAAASARALEEVRAQLASARREQSDAQARLVEMERELSAAKAVAAVNAARASDLEQEMQNLQAEMQSEQEMHAELADVSEELEALKQSFASRERELQGELEGARLTHNALEQALKDKVAMLQAKLDAQQQTANSTSAEKGAEIERLTAQLAAAAAVATELAESKAACAKLEADLAAAAAQHSADVQQREARHQSTVQEAQRAQEAADSALHALQQQMAQLQTTHAAALQAERERASAALEKEQRRSSATMQSWGKLTSQLSKTHTAARATSAATAQLRKSVATEFTDFVGAWDTMSSQLVEHFYSTSSELGIAVSRYRAEFAERRRLHNLVQELRGNIRVYCRARPILPFELAAGGTCAVSFPDPGTITVVNAKKKVKTWEFDQVFGWSATNEDVFKETQPLVVSTLDGYNVCIFAYGQTGSGKTFTMEGSEESRGVNFRALETLFQIAAARSDTYSYEISMSMLEIYNETIQDMLVPKGSVTEKLSVKEGPNGMQVPGLTIKPVHSLEDVISLMAFGHRNRTTFTTNMNEHSSRSHCMVSVYTVATHLTKREVLRGKLHLVDLAGSERVGKSGVTGDRLKEAQNINKSLSALGDVIQARADKRGHVPYRNSTLTFLLSDSLSGDSKTLMFVNLSPVLSNAEETACSLNFAARARAVELGKASKHVSKGTPGAVPATAAGGGDVSVEDDDADGGFGDADEEASPFSSAADAALSPPPTPLLSPTGSGAGVPRPSVTATGVAARVGGAPPATASTTLRRVNTAAPIAGSGVGASPSVRTPSGTQPAGIASAGRKMLAAATVKK